MARVSSTKQRKVMSKCTLCVDRVTSTDAAGGQNVKPACVLACPSKARLFGDVHDPESSEVSAGPLP
jgi:Fe-S-cluster-containing dehydrogenase component